MIQVIRYYYYLDFVYSATAMIGSLAIAVAVVGFGATTISITGNILVGVISIYTKLVY